MSHPHCQINNISANTYYLFQGKRQHVFVYVRLKIIVVWTVISSQCHIECIVEMLGTVLFT